MHEPMLRLAVFQMEASDAPPCERLNRLETALQAVSESETDILVCPELFLSGYDVASRFDTLAEPADGPFGTAVATLAAKWQTAIIYGYPEGDNGARYNSAVCFGKNGALLANYRKVNLSGDYERQHFTHGRELALFEFAGWRLALLICYDVEFPEMVRACALAGAELVIAPTAVGRPWRIIARRVVPTRAFENGVFVVYANYAGRRLVGRRLDGRRYLGASCIVSPHGCDLARAGTQEEVLTATIDFGEIAVARSRIGYLTDRCRTLDQRPQESVTRAICRPHMP